MSARVDSVTKADAEGAERRAGEETEGSSSACPCHGLSWGQCPALGAKGVQVERLSLAPESLRDACPSGVPTVAPGTAHGPALLFCRPFSPGDEQLKAKSWASFILCLPALGIQQVQKQNHTSALSERKDAQCKV